MGVGAVGGGAVEVEGVGAAGCTGAGAGEGAVGGAGGFWVTDGLRVFGFGLGLDFGDA